MRIILLCLALTSCAPILIGSGAAVMGGMAYREKGISGTFEDTSLSMKIKKRLRKRDLEWNTYLRKKVHISVQNGEALLTGNVDSEEESRWAEQVVWEVFGVKSVINQLVTSGQSRRGTLSDMTITTKCKAMLATHAQVNIRSLNYSIKTVDGIVYVMGISRSVREQQIVLNTIARVKGVKRVVCLARFKEEVLS
jgi:osmotically-inducible protein OsmY